MLIWLNMTSGIVMITMAMATSTSPMVISITSNPFMRDPVKKPAVARRVQMPSGAIAGLRGLVPMVRMNRSSRLGERRIGNSNYWIGDYTVEPEDGGVGVLRMNLAMTWACLTCTTPPEDCRSGEFHWLLDALFQRVGRQHRKTGRRHWLQADPDECLQKILLNWSNYQVFSAGSESRVKLGPANANTKQAQQLVVLLPDKQVDFTIGDPFEGSYFLSLRRWQ